MKKIAHSGCSVVNHNTYHYVAPSPTYVIETLWFELTSEPDKWSLKIDDKEIGPGFSSEEKALEYAKVYIHNKKVKRAPQ